MVRKGEEEEGKRNTDRGTDRGEGRWEAIHKMERDKGQYVAWVYKGGGGLPELEALFLKVLLRFGNENLSVLRRLRHQREHFPYREIEVGFVHL